MASYVAPTYTLAVSGPVGLALVRVIEAGIDDLERCTGAPAGDDALQDAAAELVTQLELAEQVLEELEEAFPAYTVQRNLELPLAWPSAA